MTDAERILVLRETIYTMAKVLRQHPVEMDWYYEDMERLAILAGGMERDPEGKEWANYFVSCSHQKLKEEGII